MCDTKPFTVKAEEMTNEDAELYTSDEGETKSSIVESDPDNDVMRRLTKIEGKVAALEDVVQRRDSDITETLHRVKHVEEMLSELLRRIPPTDTGEIRYTYVTPAFVAQLRELKGANVTHFALALESEIYKDDTSELELPVDRRVTTKDKVIFLRQCVYEYYCVPEHLKEPTWKRVREALDSRVRRLRKRARDIQSNSSSL